MTNPKYKQLMTHKAKITQLGRNSEGDWVVAATYTDIPSFFEWGKKVVTDRKGEEVTAVATVFLMPDAPIVETSDQWKLEQTNPYSRQETTMIRVDPIDDPRTGKTHHLEVAVL
jgi:hypothetical protein